MVLLGSDTLDERSLKFMKIAKVIASGLFVGGFLLATAGARAESLAEREKWAHQNSYVSGAIRDANKDCGIDPKKPITLVWDKTSFAKPGGDSNSPSSYCGNVFTALEGVCSGPEDWKKPVQDQVKKVVCRYGGKGNFGMSLANGVRTYTIDYEESGIDRKINDYIESHLTTASGESVAMRRAWLAQQSYIAGAVEDINRKCKVEENKKVTFEYDRPSFANESWADHAPNRACAEVVNDVAYLCSGSDPDRASAAVRKKVNKIVCKYGGKNKWGIALSGGTLTYTVDWDEKNPGEKINAFLKKNL